jgi:hypothetical protein
MDVQLYTFLTAVLNGGEWSASRSNLMDQSNSFLKYLLSAGSMYKK